jgi:hypothetical protein
MQNIIYIALIILTMVDEEYLPKSGDILYLK